MVISRKDLKRLIRENGLSLKSASVAIGKNDAYLQQYVNYNKPNELPEGVREALAPILGCEPDDLRLMPKNPSTFGRANEANLKELVAHDSASGAKDFPIFAVARGGSEGMIVTYDPIEYKERPAPLAGVKGAFGVYMIGESMEPAYQTGDMLLIHPTKPPRINDDILIITGDENGGELALVKRLVKQTATNLVVRQFNPPKDFDIPISDGTRVMLITGVYKRQ